MALFDGSHPWVEAWVCEECIAAEPEFLLVTYAFLAKFEWPRDVPYLRSHGGTLCRVEDLP